MRLPRVAGDRGASVGGRPRPMLGRGRPDRLMSAVVSLNKPLGIAVMELPVISLSVCTAADGKKSHGDGVGGDEEGA